MPGTLGVGENFGPSVVKLCCNGEGGRESLAPVAERAGPLAVALVTGPGARSACPALLCSALTAGRLIALPLFGKALIVRSG